MNPFVGGSLILLIFVLLGLTIGGINGIIIMLLVYGNVCLLVIALACMHLVTWLGKGGDD